MRINNIRRIFDGKYRLFVIVVLIGLIVGVYSIYSENYRAESLKHSTKTWAVISNVFGGTYKMSGNIDLFYFNEKGKRVDIEDQTERINCSGVRKEGDTILIRYSLTDNNVVEVVNCYGSAVMK